MCGQIHVPANRVWAYYKRYQGELISSYHLIADWEDFGIEVYITDEENHVAFVVYADEVSVYEGEAGSRDECESVADIIYDTYLTPNVIGVLQKTESEAAEESFDEIDAREADLDIALSDFLGVVLEKGEIVDNPDAIVPGDDLFEEIKDHFLEYLGCDVGYKVYRPTLCTGTDGSAHVVNYPYELYDSPSRS